MQFISGSNSAHLLPETFEQQISKMFIQMRESLQQRMAVLYKTQHYFAEQYHQTLKKYRRVVSAELSIQTERYSFEKLMVGQLAKAPRLTKQMKGMMTEFCFLAIDRLAPGFEAKLDMKIERYYANIPRLLEVFFTLSGSDLVKKVLEMKGSGLVFRAELYVGLLKLLLEHIHKTFVERLTQINKKIDQMIDLSMRGQMLLENTSKSFYFNVRKLKTETLQDPKLKPSPYLQQLKRVTQAESSSFSKALFQSRKLSLNQTQNNLLQGSMTQVQIPLRVRKIMRMKLKEQLSITMMNRTNVMKEESRVQLANSVEKKRLPSIKIVMKSPSLKNYNEHLRAQSKDQLKEISSTHIVREVPSLSPIKTNPNIISNVSTTVNTTTTRFNNVFNEFLDIFHGNLKSQYKMSDLQDLEYEWCSNRRNRLLQKDKADWLNKNLLKVIQYLTVKNCETSKALEQYSNKYQVFKQKSLTLRRRNTVKD